MGKTSKTTKMIGLFLAASMTVAACAPDDSYSDDCEDQNNDGNCDDGSGPVGSSYIDYDGKKKYKRVSSGAKSGIGSSLSSSGS